MIPTLSQVGYAGALLFPCPLGDLFWRQGICAALGVVYGYSMVSHRCRRAIVLIGSDFLDRLDLRIGLCFTNSLLHIDRRASALSIVFSGLLLGILSARVLSAVVSEYASWRNIYWRAFGLHYVILVLLCFFLPDYSHHQSRWPQLRQDALERHH